MPLDSGSPDFSASGPSPEATLAADAAGAHATESHGHHGPFHTHCENCGTKLAGPYCHACGQHDFEFHRSFRHVFMDALENFFHFDSKLFRDTTTLIFQPGRLSADFNAGKRASQMPPFRLYLFVSFAFFAIQFFGDNPALDHAVVQDPVAKKQKEEIAKEVIAGVNQYRELKQPNSPRTAADKPPELDFGGGKIRLDEKTDTAFARFLNEKGRRAFEHPEAVKEAFIHAIPRMLLVSLPFFALYTRFLFRKSGQVYLQHLVVALHFHTFIYLFLLFRQGWIGLFQAIHFPSVAGLLSFAAVVWLGLYPFLMFRRLFGDSKTKTFVKTGLLLGVYALTLGFVFFWAIVIIFMSV